MEISITLIVELLIGLSMLGTWVWYLSKIAAAVKVNTANILKIEAEQKSMEKDIHDIQIKENVIVAKIEEMVKSVSQVHKQNDEMLKFLQDLIKIKSV